MSNFLKALQIKFKKFDKAFDKFHKTAIGKFIIDKIILRTKSFYSILFTFGLILVGQISAYNNVMYWSNKVEIQLSNAEGFSYIGWFIVSLIVPEGSLFLIIVLLLILFASWIIRYKELSQNKIPKSEVEIRSEFLLNKIKENEIFYVLTDNHNKAIKKLDKSNIIIIAGNPGIGKTTLAEQIILDYSKKGFKFYDIKTLLSEAFKIYKNDEKQIFYLDDFLGENYLNAIENKQASDIVKFIDIIKKDKRKRFILTSRTNIFNQCLQLSDTIKNKNLENEEFIINIDSLKDIDKAKILYNHMNYNNLDEEFVNQICIDKRYKTIISHKNFNPRLIAFITDTKRIEKENVQVDNYWAYILEKLDNPQDIWKNTFDKQSDEFTRIIVFLVVFNGNRINENKLRTSYFKYLKLTNLTNTSNSSNDFDSIIEEVVRYFLNRNQYDKKVEYSLFNPSIADFVLMKYKNNISILENTFKSLESDTSLNKLAFLMKNEVIKKDDYLLILEELQKDAQLQKDTNYLIKLNYLINRDCPKNTDFKLLKNLIQNIIDGHIWTSLVEELDILVNLFDSSKFNISDFDFFYMLIPYHSSDIYEINSVISLYNYFGVNDEKIDYDINETIIYYLKEKLQEEADSIYEYNVQFEEVLNEDGTFKILDGEIEQIIDDKYSELESEIEYFKGFTIDENDVRSEIDIDDIEQRLSSDYTSEKYREYVDDEDDNEHSLSDTKDDIESLFEK